MTEPILAFEHGLNRTQVAQLVFGRMSETGWLHLERALMTTKWFDYRFMPPFEATLCYICEYNIAYKHFRGSNFDHETSKHVKLVEPHYFYKMKTFEKHKKTLRSLWRGRQIADMAGMPYGVFLSIAFELRLRYWKRSFMPQANQVYTFDETKLEHICAKWRERQEGILYFGRHQNYRLHRYRDHRAQNDHHEWLFKQSDIRENGLHLLARFINEELLPEEKVRSRIGPERFEKLQAYM